MRIKATYTLSFLFKIAEKVESHKAASITTLFKNLSSVHATLRRYVETSLKRCALPVLNKTHDRSGVLQLRDYFQSKKMTNEIWEHFDARNF